MESVKDEAKGLVDLLDEYENDEELTFIVNYLRRYELTDEEKEYLIDHITLKIRLSTNNR